MDQISRAQFLVSDETQNTTEKAYRKIKLFFYHQRLISGQKLFIDELARSFDMSRTPVINALGRLAQEGYVTLKPNRGFFVSKISRKEAKENIEARQVIEEYCVKKVIERLKNDFKQEHREYLENLMDYYRNSGTSWKDKARIFIDRDFHVGICKLAGNSIMQDMMSQLFEKIYLRYSLYSMPDRFAEAKREHQEFMKAIIALDTDTALAVLKQHYKGVRNFISLGLERENIK